VTLTQVWIYSHIKICLLTDQNALNVVQSTLLKGKIHNGKRKFKCQSCERQFIENPTHKVIDAQTKELIDQPLRENLFS